MFFTVSIIIRIHLQQFLDVHTDFSYDIADSFPVCLELNDEGQVAPQSVEAVDCEPQGVVPFVLRADMTMFDDLCLEVDVIVVVVGIEYANVGVNT